MEENSAINTENAVLVKPTKGKRFFNLLSNRKRLFSILAVLVVLAAIPITVTLQQKTTQTKSLAAENVEAASIIQGCAACNPTMDGVMDHWHEQNTTACHNNLDPYVVTNPYLVPGSQSQVKGDAACSNSSVSIVRGCAACYPTMDGVMDHWHEQNTTACHNNLDPYVVTNPYLVPGSQSQVKGDAACSNSRTSKAIGVTGKKIYYYGDSIGFRAKTQIAYELNAKNWTPVINSLGGRTLIDIGNCPYGGTCNIDSQASTIKDAGVIIVELGTNDCSVSVSSTEFKNRLNILYSKLRSMNSTARYYWIDYAFKDDPNNPTSYCKGAYMATRNQDLRDFIADGNKDITIIPWSSIGVQYLIDAVHPGETGYTAFAKLITNTIGSYAELKIPILSYYSIDKASLPGPYGRSMTVNYRDFRRQMAILRARGYHPVTLNQIYNKIWRDQPLPSKPIAITFNGGYLSQYRYAYPILKSYNFPATFFIITNVVGQKGTNSNELSYFGWDEISKMKANGMEFQSQTATSTDLTTASPDRLVNELTQSKQILISHGVNATAISYPGGKYNQSVLDATKQAGYLAGVSLDPGKIMYYNQLYYLPRIGVTPGLSLSSFTRLLE